MKIAILDDDSQQAQLVCQALTSAGHSCHAYATGRALLAHLRQDSHDMLIMHWQGPLASLLEVLQWARESLPGNLPVLLIANRAGEDEIIAGLEAGANDYLLKPVRRGELVARTQVLLRCAYPARLLSEQVRFGDYLFETRSARLTVGEKAVELTQKEFDLALLFFRNMGRPLSRAYILEAVWARAIEVPSRTMDTHVSRIRSKLHLRPENGFTLAPVYSYGYRLEQTSE